MRHKMFTVSITYCLENHMSTFCQISGHTDMASWSLLVGTPDHFLFSAKIDY